MLWQINTDANLPTYGLNFVQQGENFAKMARGRSAWYKHKHVMIPFGCDFAHQNAQRSFKQLDQLINYINSNKTYDMTLHYSFFSDYVKAVHNEQIAWTLHKPEDGDFFPYASNWGQYWTGYFTSRFEAGREGRREGGRREGRERGARGGIRSR